MQIVQTLSQTSWRTLQALHLLIEEVVAAIVTDRGEDLDKALELTTKDKTVIMWRTTPHWHQITQDLEAARAFPRNLEVTSWGEEEDELAYRVGVGVEAVVEAMRIKSCP